MANAVIWLAILMGYGLMLIDLMVSGRIVYLLHPRMYGFVWFGLAMFLVLFGHQAYTVYQRYKKFKATKGVPSNGPGSSGRFKVGYLVFLLPLLLAATRPQVMSSDVLSNKAILLGQSSITSVKQAPVQEDQEIQETQVTQTSQAQAQDDFYQNVTALQSTYGTRIGETLTLKGLVYRQDDFKPSEMVVARLLITCCASDAGVLGVMVTADQDLSNYASDSWVKVTGTIDLPMLKLTAIEAIEPFDNPYVYPN